MDGCGGQAREKRAAGKVDKVSLSARTHSSLVKIKPPKPEFPAGGSGRNANLEFRLSSFDFWHLHDVDWIDINHHLARLDPRLLAVVSQLFQQCVKRGA